MKTVLQVCREPAGEADELAAQQAETISFLFRDFHIALPKATVIRRDESLARRTTLRVGGPADLYVEPPTESALATVLELCALRRAPILVLGRGSNLLVRDGGFRGVAISLASAEFSRIEAQEGQLRVGAGARLKQVATEARRLGWSGLEFLEGIPGSMGGALRMNAGAMGVEMFDQVVSLTFLDEDGEIRTRERDEITAEYRNVGELRRNFALEVVLSGTSDSKENIQRRWDESRAKRQKTQPIAASAGCMFKNPELIPAGKLVDEMGLKGCRVGHAEVSAIHGNFIVNTGGATTADVLALVEQIRDKARAERGIEMEMEVKVIGEDDYTF